MLQDMFVLYETQHETKCEMCFKKQDKMLFSGTSMFQVETF